MFDLEVAGFIDLIRNPSTTSSAQVASGVEAASWVLFDDKSGHQVFHGEKRVGIWKINWLAFTNFFYKRFCYVFLRVLD